MTAFREPSLNERQSAAAKAKEAALAKFRAKPRPGEPAFAQQQADRMTQATKRAAAREARAVEKAEKKARDAELLEHAARAAASKAANDLAEQAAREASRRAEQKAARDKRYAARKARKS